jgi:hypothetical protein
MLWASKGTAGMSQHPIRQTILLCHSCTERGKPYDALTRTKKMCPQTPSVLARAGRITKKGIEG